MPDRCSVGATSESLNRLAKLEARLAYGFRNPLNQRRRVRIACTRGYRRRARTSRVSSATKHVDARSGRAQAAPRITSTIATDFWPAPAISGAVVSTQEVWIVL
jgi:hypothetical protein